MFICITLRTYLEIVAFVLGQLCCCCCCCTFLSLISGWQRLSVRVLWLHYLPAHLHSLCKPGMWHCIMMQPTYSVVHCSAQLYWALPLKLCFKRALHCQPTLVSTCQCDTPLPPLPSPSRLAFCVALSLKAQSRTFTAHPKSLQLQSTGSCLSLRYFSFPQLYYNRYPKLVK